LDKYNYSPDPLVVGGTRLGPFKYYKKKYGSAIQHVGTIDTNVASAEAQSEADFAAMKSLGYKIVYQRTANPLESDFTDDILKMQADGVQMVYIVGEDVEAVAEMAKEMKQEGFTPKLFSTNGVAYDSSYIPDAGTAANGTYTDLQTALYGGQDAKSVPAVALFDKWVKKVNPTAAIDTYAVYGWASAQLFVQALKAAGPNPTRSELFTQLNKITSFSANGLLANGNPAQKVPETCWILAKVSNGKWGRVPPSPKSGYVCSPGGYYYPPGYKPFTRN
jgi:ABC-type branched-subunit amino acid transport system substrate-binding protein